MMHSFCDNCQDHIACAESGGCILLGVMVSLCQNMNVGLSGPNLNFSQTHEEVQMTRPMTRGDWYDNNGIDVVN